MDEGLRIFLQESHENLERFERDVLVLESSGASTELVRGIFRAVHTMKGMCGYLGLRRLEAITHAGEELLAGLREGRIAVSAELARALLLVGDAVKGILAGLAKDEREPAGDDRALVAELERLARGGEAPAPAPEPEEAAAPRSELQGLRVDLQVLDRLMNRTEELVLVRNRLAQLVQADESSPYQASVAELARVTSELQDVVMRTRMQDIGHAWRRLPRIVRDLTTGSAKQIQLEMVGGETQVDRQVLDAIEEPFIHMVRNSADHGIEPVAVRLSRGKPAHGTITMRAYQEGGNILVEISDDGAGVDVDAIRRKLPPELAQTLTDAECLDRVFESGFSTAAAVTAVSGRGVGMDVVRAKIEGIGGTVSIHSTRGAGTTIRVRIPLTLAITSALIVAAGGQAFAIPQASVVELVRIFDDNRHLVEELHDSRVFRLRDSLLTLVRLDEVLELAPSAGAREECVAVVQADGREFGLIVDAVFDTEEIVVKPLGRLVAGLEVYGGTTILGDGRIIMILDPPGIANRAKLRVEAELSERAPEALERKADLMHLLTFEGGDGARLAVPLALVSRLEEIPRERIERVSDRAVVQYRGALMPLVPVHGYTPGEEEPQPLVVFSDGERAMGLMVRAIRDIVTTTLNLEARSDRKGFLGAAIVDGAATDILDIHEFLRIAHPDWFGARKNAISSGKRVLVVDDSAFFRSLIAPLLQGLGYHLTLAADGQEALAILDAGAPQAVVLCDIEMPRVDGHELARRLKSHPKHAGVPLVALTVHSTSRDRERALESGFDDYLVKFDQEAVLASLARVLGRFEGERA